MTDALRIERLIKRYGSVQALHGVDLRVAEGEVFGFLGPNGAGKSTTIRIILDLIRPTSGAVSVFGLDCQRQSVEVRERVGYLPSDPVYGAGATGMDVFTFTAAARRQPFDARHAGDLAERLALDPSRKIAQLSRGNRQKVGIIQALLTRAPLLVLDEPTTGLDPLNQHEVEGMLREAAAEGTTVFFSSHILSEVESICARSAIVRAGEVVETVDLEEQRRVAPVHVEVELDGGLPAGALPPGVELTGEHAGRLILTTQSDALDGSRAMAGGPARPAPRGARAYA
ncbi:MAG: ATP-binding cassette domain-containing protein [Dehalococcoidia bacterium]|nr:MAG: ATP-binding cassette domain-containing protein [Dehalococcoidia bacterium]